MEVALIEVVVPADALFVFLHDPIRDNLDLLIDG